MTNVLLPVDFKDVPNIPANIKLEDKEQINLLIPKGFEQFIEWRSENGNLVLVIKNAEQEDNRETKISPSLFNPSKSGSYWPKFLFEVSTLGLRTSYFQKDSEYILNQNQMLYMLLQHRLCMYASMNKAWIGVLVKDIEALMSFVGYVKPVAYNAIKRLEHTYVVLSPWTQGSTLEFRELKSRFDHKCIGDVLKHRTFIPTEGKWKEICKDMDIHPSSESSMSKTAKIVVKPFNQGELYRSVGYRLFTNTAGDVFAKSLFKAAQNITARWKTHTISNAYETANPATSIFIQDMIHDGTKYVNKDNCLVRALVVFNPMCRKTKRFLGGEVEASASFVKTVVWKTKNVTQEFESIALEIGKTIESDDQNRVLIGYGINSEPVYFYDCLSMRLEGITYSGDKAVPKLRLRYSYNAGNGRLDSNTGFKGVTKAIPYTGKIVFPNFTMIPDSDTNESAEPHWQQSEACDKYPARFKDKFMDLVLKPDLIAGMNAIKAKGNSIALARAALAVELGTYKPTHDSGLLNTWNEGEINNASNSLPEFKYINKFGVEEAVDVGVVYVRYTELGVLHTKFKDQSFMFESGRGLHSNENNELFDVIWKNYIDPDKLEAIKELQKIICDKTGAYQKLDDLPMYTPEKLFENFKGKLFTVDDLILKTMLGAESNSKILDEEWNKGFYINLKDHDGPVVRIPSAKTFNIFISELQDKMWIYPAILINACKMIEHCLNIPKNEGKPKIGYIFDVNGKRYTAHRQYMEEIKSVLYSGEESAQMMIQLLSKPQIKGFSLKQVVEPLLPKNVVCILNDRLYNQALEHVYGEDKDYYELTHGLYALSVRNPSLWKSQIKAPRVWNYEDLRAHLLNNHGICIKDYLCKHENNDILLVSEFIVFEGHSDSDGDLLPLFFLRGIDAQRMLKNVVFTNIHEDEIEWNRKYMEGEYDANFALVDPSIKTHNVIRKQVYKLFDVALKLMRDHPKNPQTYTEYLVSATIAKNAIGPSTNDGWKFVMIAQCYRAYHKEHGGTYVDGKHIEEMYNISDVEFVRMCFAYVRALQDFVVTGVKHNTNGSKGFDMLYLRNFHKSDNAKPIHNMLVQEFELPPLLASKMLTIVSWAENSGLLSACSSFLALYNKGKEETDPVKSQRLAKWDIFIQKNTFFGMLLESVYVIKNQARFEEEQRLLRMAEKRAKLGLPPKK